MPKGHSLSPDIIHNEDCGHLPIKKGTNLAATPLIPCTAVSFPSRGSKRPLPTPAWPPGSGHRPAHLGKGRLRPHSSPSWEVGRARIQGNSHSAISAEQSTSGLTASLWSLSHCLVEPSLGRWTQPYPGLPASTLIPPLYQR